MSYSIYMSDYNRAELEEMFGELNVYTTNEAMEAFEFISFLAPEASVVRKADGQPMKLIFQHRPRFYIDVEACD